MTTTVEAIELQAGQRIAFLDCFLEIKTVEYLADSECVRVTFDPALCDKPAHWHRKSLVSYLASRPVRSRKFYRPVSYGASDKKGRNKYRVEHMPYNDYAAAVDYVKQEQGRCSGLELEHVHEDVIEVEKFEEHGTGNAT